MTQCDKILEYMKRHPSGITAQEAAAKKNDIHCMRLAARIFDLKAKRHEIGKVIETYKNDDGYTVNYARYFLIKEADDGRAQNDCKNDN